MKKMLIFISLAIPTILLLSCPNGITPDEQLEQPIITSLNGASFNSKNTVTITALEGSAIYYTTNGSLPTIASTLYSAPFEIEDTTTIKAIATKEGYTNSLVTSVIFTVQDKTTTPSITSLNGNLFNTSTEITITAADGAAIYYTIDGTVPTSASVLYSNSFEIDDTKTIKAIAVKTGFSDSLVKSETFTIMNKTTAPIFSSSNGNPFNTLTDITMNADLGATIFYTTDIESENPMYHNYSSPVRLTSTKTIKAIAVKTGFSDSSVKSETFTIMNKTTAPIITSSNGTPFDTITEITITAASGATIYYTTDKTDPTTSSTQYLNPFEINNTTTIKAVAVKADSSDSQVKTATFEIIPIKEIGIGNGFTLVLMADGSLWGMGVSNQVGLGIGSNPTVYEPPIKILNAGVKSLSVADGYAMIIKDDNTLWASGTNNGRFGNGSISSSPVFVHVRDNVIAVSCGDTHTAIIGTDNKIYTTGDNTCGQLGLGNNIDSNIFIIVPGPFNFDVKSIDSGYSSTYFINGLGNLVGFGLNILGQLGQGNDLNTNSAVLISPNISSFSAGFSHLLYVDTLNNAFGLGSIYNGEIGDGILHPQFTHTNLPLPLPFVPNIKRIVAGKYCSMILTSDNKFYVSGSDSSNKLGDGNSVTDSYLSFTQIPTHPNNIVKVFAGYDNTFVVDANGACYGAGNDNQLGTGSFNIGNTNFKLIEFNEADD